MLHRNQLTAKIKQLLPEAELIYLFGSQVDESNTSESDIDVAVLMDKKLDPITRFDIQETLAIVLNQDVDLVDLLSASTVMQNQIITQGICLYGSETKQCQFEMQVLSMYQRLNTERQDILQEYTK